MKSFQMLRIPAVNYNLSHLEDEDVIAAWKWFLSFISEKDWQNRKANIEKKIAIEFKSFPNPPMAPHQPLYWLLKKI